MQTQSGEQHSQISNLKAYSREQEPQQQTQAVLRAFDEQYTAIQNIFRSDEASIYKQGNKLVISVITIHEPEILFPRNIGQPDILRFDKSNLRVSFRQGASENTWELSERGAIHRRCQFQTLGRLI